MGKEGTGEGEGNQEPAARRYGSCAVVGSSGRLVGAGHGTAIDDHDAVIRFNQAPTEGGWGPQRLLIK